MPTLAQRAAHVLGYQRLAGRQIPAGLAQRGRQRFVAATPEPGQQEQGSGCHERQLDKPEHKQQQAAHGSKT